MQTKQIFLVTGIEPSKGEMTDQKTGKPFNWDSTNFHIQVPTKHGHGFKGATQKMTGSINYDRFKNVVVPCEMEFEFFIEVNGQFLKSTLTNVTQVKTSDLSKA